MLEFLKSVEYKTLIVKMSQDNPVIVQAKLKFDMLCDIHTLLTLFCLVPLGVCQCFDQVFPMKGCFHFRFCD